MKVLKYILALAVSVASFQPAAAKVDFDSLTPDQQNYLRAKKYYINRQFEPARELKNRLRNYVLYPYLEYFDLYYNARPERADEAMRYIATQKNDGINGDIQAKYVRTLVNAGQYAKALKVRTKPFRMNELNCLRNTAIYHVGSRKDALNFAKNLYMKQSQYPSECNFLMQKLREQGMLNSASTYTKLLRKFRERRQNEQVARLAKELEKTNFASSARIVNYLYSHPEDLLDKLDTNVTNYQNIAVGSILILARTKSEAAYNLLQQAKTRYKLTSEQILEAGSYIIRHMMIQKNANHMHWLDQTLLQLKHTDDLIPNRVKYAIWQENWKDLDFWLKKLSAKEAKDSKWIYWRAYALEKQGRKEEARNMYLKVLKERNFYSFLVAQKYSIPWPFLEQRVWMSPMDEQKALKQWVEFARVHELIAIGDLTNAGREWYYFITRLTPDEVAKAGVLAYNKGWYDYSLKASIYGKAWNLLKLRFPTPLLDYYTGMSKQTGVSLSFLYAISRQESALNPSAVSPAGAKGMMQLMPATASLVAKKYRIPYTSQDQLLDPKINISLGAHYLMKLLGEYNNNRVLAAVAYNAGPHRVEAWRSKDGVGKTVDVWVENIPFNETRGYVQNVLVFDAIYQKYLNQEPYFLTREEFSHRY